MKKVSVKKILLRSGLFILVAAYFITPNRVRKVSVSSSSSQEESSSEIFECKLVEPLSYDDQFE